MTTYNKASLKTFFEQNDIPTGTDYANLIDSQINIVETSVQEMAGALFTPELTATRVSAGSGVFNGSFTFNGSAAFNGDFTNFTGTLVEMDAATYNNNATTYNNNSTNYNNNSTTATFNNSNSIFNGNLVVNQAYQGSIAIVSAAGSAQATATIIPISTVTIRLQGTTDGQATGYKLARQLLNTTTPTIQYLIHEGAVSGNLWPNVGCSINGLSTNTPFPLAANTPYVVIYKSASAYAVK